MSLPEQNTPQTQSGKSSLSPGLIPSFETPQSHQFPQEPPPKISNQITFVLNIFTDHYAIKKKRGGKGHWTKDKSPKSQRHFIIERPPNIQVFQVNKTYLPPLSTLLLLLLLLLFFSISKLYLTLLLENFKGVEVGSNLEEVVIQELISSFK